VDQIIDLTNVIRDNPVERFQDILDRDKATDWPAEAQDLLRRSTAKGRDRMRTARCRQVALHVARTIDPMNQRDGEIASLLLHAGWCGTGGHWNIGASMPGNTRATARIWPWGGCCGKGRANASDGPAWCGAMQSAQYQIREEITGDYDAIGYLTALEIILAWAESAGEAALAWGDEIRDCLRAIAGQSIVLGASWDEDRGMWAQIYALCCSPVAWRDVQALRLRLEDERDAQMLAKPIANPGDPSIIWRAED